MTTTTTDFTTTPDFFEIADAIKADHTSVRFTDNDFDGFDVRLGSLGVTNWFGVRIVKDDTDLVIYRFSNGASSDYCRISGRTTVEAVAAIALAYLNN